MTKYILIALLLCAVPCAAGIITPPLNIDGNGNVPQQYWNGTEWKTCTGTVSITNSDGDTLTVYIRGYNTAGAPVNALFNQASSDVNPSTRYGLVTNSRMAYYDETLGTWVRMRGDTVGGMDVQIGDYLGTSAKFDSTTRSIVTVDYAHKEIHSGSSFMVDTNADIPSGDTIVMMLVTPNTTRWAHMYYVVETEGEADFTLWEGSDTIASGTALPVYNRNRNFSTVSTVFAYQQPVVKTFGTRLRRVFLGSGRNTGSGDRGVQEIVLKSNTMYLFVVENKAGTGNRVSMRVNWYEHTNY